MTSVPTVPPGNTLTLPPAAERDDDILNGGSEICAYWNSLTGRRDSLANIYAKLAAGTIPAKRIGNLYFSSRRAIRQSLAIDTGR